MTSVEYRSHFELTQDTLYFALMAKLYSVFVSISWENDNDMKRSDCSIKDYNSYFSHWPLSLTYINFNCSMDK